jgi:hypothetical protein
MKTILAASILLFAAAPVADELRFAPEKGAKVQKTIRHETKLESQSFAMEFDGEEVQPPGEMPKLSLSDESEFVFSEEFVASADGRATILVREYDTISGTVVQAFSMGEQSEDESKDKSSKLAGKSVKFTWDGEKEEHAAAWASEDAEKQGDEELLEELDADTDLVAFLPGKGVAEGDTWEVEAKHLVGLFSPGGDLSIDTGEEEDQNEEDLDDQMDENMAGKVVCTYAGRKEIAGAKVAVVEVSIEATTTGEVEGEEGGTRTLKVGWAMKGELHWDPAANRLLGYEIEGDTDFEMATAAEIDAGGEQHSMKQTVSFKGSTKLSCKVE